MAVEISHAKMVSSLKDHAFSTKFLKFMVKRGVRTEADIIDQLFNSSEKRLARTLLLMSGVGLGGENLDKELLRHMPPITQQELASMVGTTRSRVSFFMNRFRKLKLIDYNGHIQVFRALLEAVLKDNLPEENSSRPVMLDPVRHRRKTTKSGPPTAAA